MPKDRRLSSYKKSARFENTRLFSDLEAKAGLGDELAPHQGALYGQLCTDFVRYRVGWGAAAPPNVALLCSVNHIRYGG